MKSRYLILLLTLFSVLAYHSWFSLDIFTHGDWWFNYKESISESIHPNIWQSRLDIGQIDPTPFRVPLNELEGILAYLFHFDSNIIDRILFFWPHIFLLPIASYLFIRKLVKDDIAALASAFVISFNTYFLAIDTAGHNLITVAAAFAILGLFYVISAVEEKKTYQWVSAGVLFSLCGIVDFRILYVTMVICGAIYLRSLYLTRRFTEVTKPWLLFGSILAFLNIFWLLPLLFLSTGFGEGVLARPLFGDQFWSLAHALVLTHPFWTGSEPAWFTSQAIPFYFWLTPLLAVCGFLVARKNAYAILFACIGMLGIFLSKQSDAPFESFYLWAYQHVPGFNAFREATKFYILIALSYAVLIAFLVKWFLKVNTWKPFTYLLPLGICVLFGFNTLPMISGSIETMFVPKQIHPDYLALKNTLARDGNFSRTYWAPTSDKWTFGSSLHPSGSVNTLTADALFQSNLINKNDPANLQISHAPSQGYSDALFDALSVKYVGIPTRGLEIREDKFKDYGGKTNPNIQQWYIDQLSALPYLKRADIGTKELAVYENKDYLPYIRSMNSLIGYDSLTHLEEKYAFSKDILALPFDFTVLQHGAFSIPSTNVAQQFESLHPTDINDRVLTQLSTSSLETQQTLFVNTSKRFASFLEATNTLELKTSYVPGFHLNETILDQGLGTSTLTATVTADGAHEYIALFGSQVTHLKKNTSWQSLGTTNRPLTIYEVDSTNTVPNGSFEMGLWQDTVSDCSNYDNNSVLAMTQSSLSSHGSSSLELSAARHIACTNTVTEPLDTGEWYLFSFDYESDRAKQAGYYLSFGDSTSTALNEHLPISSKGWRTYERMVHIPTESQRARITLYAYATDDTTQNLVHYDTVQFKKLREIQRIDLESPTHFESIPLPKADKYTFSFSDPTKNLSNIVPNGDFSKGLWSDTVGDCNNYNDNGLLDMRTVEDSRDNGISLELETTRHTACTGPNPLPVTEGSTYLLSFDYQSNNKTEASFYIDWSGTSTPAVNERLPITDTSWHTYTKQITIPDGASSASLLLYAFEKDGVTPIKVRYDNLSLIELPDIANRYYVVSDPQTNFVNPSSITFDLINPTKKLVHIKGATTPFYLAMSESFHPQWQAQFNNSKVHGFFRSWVPFVKPDNVANDNHFKLDGFLNGWYIDTDAYCGTQNLCTKNPDGSYDMELVVEFTPQRWFYLGLLISGSTLVLCVGYLVYDAVRRRRRRTAWIAKAHNIH